jgi:hypothetical protein
MSYVGYAGWYGEAPATPRVDTLRIVVKSFIECIGTAIGTLPFRCNLVPGPGTTQVRLAALAVATDRMMCENPMHDRKDKGYRLYSACTLRVTCRNGQLVDVIASQLDTDSGKEGPLQTPPLITSPVNIVRLPDGFEFGWSARGRPHIAVEPGFQLVCPRTSVFIWHRISGRVQCTPSGARVSVNLSGSKFPTHRAFVNGKVVSTVAQHEFARLWFPASLTQPTLVE